MSATSTRRRANTSGRWRRIRPLALMLGVMASDIGCRYGYELEPLDDASTAGNTSSVSDGGASSTGGDVSSGGAASTSGTSSTNVAGGGSTAGITMASGAAAGGSAGGSSGAGGSGSGTAGSSGNGGAGGTSGAPGSPGQPCSAASDCLSGVCSAKICQAPTCKDGVQNGTESDVDCGGSCGATCGNGRSCTANSDCSSGNCASKTCAIMPETGKYGFETNAQGWGSDGTPLQSVAWTTAKAFQGTGSLVATFDGTAGQTAARLFSPSPVPAAGQVVTFHVWVPSGSAINWIQPFIFENGGTYRWVGTQVPLASLKVNAWNAIQFTADTWTPGEIGVQFNVGSGSTGSVYIDTVSW